MNDLQISNDNRCNCTSMNTAQRAFLVYVNTLQFLKTRLRGIDEDDAVHVPSEEIERRFFGYPKHDRKKELAHLVEVGELDISKQINPKTGRAITLYRTLREGRVDLYMVRPKSITLDPTTKSMRDILLRVSLPGDISNERYFRALMFYRNDILDYFFCVDDFSGRVHTPITSLHRAQRERLLIDNTPTTSIDVCTMQPLILAKVLREQLECNQFTEWIESGEDIYTMLQRSAKLEGREQGKDRFFEILFSKPNNRLVETFGSAEWITWINHYKTLSISGNPHGKEKPHSNLAWLMQSSEVKIMRQVWKRLVDENIPFLSVHDEIITKAPDITQAEVILRCVLDREFKFYKLNVKGPSQGTTISDILDVNSPENSRIAPSILGNYMIGGDGLLYIYRPGEQLPPIFESDRSN